jgi:hypothetical protein
MGNGWLQQDCLIPIATGEVRNLTATLKTGDANDDNDADFNGDGTNFVPVHLNPVSATITRFDKNLIYRLTTKRQCVQIRLWGCVCRILRYRRFFQLPTVREEIGAMK